MAEREECVPIVDIEEPEVSKPEELPDECWEQKYPNDSRPWILKDLRKSGPFASCMRESYVEPKISGEPIGRRRELLQAFVWKELSKQAIDNLKKIPPVEPYVTTYSCAFEYGGLLEKTPEREAEIRKLKYPFEETEDKQDLFMKYPLYKSHQNTYWMQNLKTGNITGTTAGSIRDPFRKSSTFTTPIDKQFYEPPEGLN